MYVKFCPEPLSLSHLSGWTASASQGSSAHSLRPADPPGKLLLRCGTASCGSPLLWARSSLQIRSPRTSSGCWFYPLWEHRAPPLCDSSWAWPVPAPAGPRTSSGADPWTAACSQNSRISWQPLSSRAASSSPSPSWWCPCLPWICLRLWGAVWPEGALRCGELGA